MAARYTIAACLVVLVVHEAIVSTDAAAVRGSAQTGGDVFLVQGCKGKKTLNFYDARKECSQRYGATIAGYRQLRQAWLNGLESCNPGWISMWMVMYPMQRARMLCGNRRGLISLGFTHLKKEYDVYCYPNGRNVYSVIGCGGSLTLTYDQAVDECERRGDVIATYEQLYAEWEKGFEYCGPGWLADGRVGYASQAQTCNEEPGVRLVTGDDIEEGGSGLYEDLRFSTEKYDVFCSRQGILD